MTMGIVRLGKFAFPRMTTPPEDLEPGSAEWAASITMRTYFAIERIFEDGAKPLVEALLQAVPNSPWLLFPEGAPCRDVDAWCMGLCGRDWAGILRLVRGVDEDAYRQLKAKMPAELATAGGDHGNQYGGPKRQGDIVTLAAGERGNSDAYLSARLKRDAPEVWSSYMAGKHKSVRSAALAAGIVKPRATIPSDMPIEDLAAQLNRRFNREQRRRLAASLLSDHAGGSDPTRNEPNDPWSDIAIEMHLLLQAGDDQ